MQTQASTHTHTHKYSKNSNDFMYCAEAQVKLKSSVATRGTCRLVTKSSFLLFFFKHYFHSCCHTACGNSEPKIKTIYASESITWISKSHFAAVMFFFLLFFFNQCLFFTKYFTVNINTQIGDMNVYNETLPNCYNSTIREPFVLWIGKKKQT